MRFSGAFSISKFFINPLVFRDRPQAFSSKTESYTSKKLLVVTCSS